MSNSKVFWAIVDMLDAVRKSPAGINYPCTEENWQAWQATQAEDVDILRTARELVEKYCVE